MDDQEFYLELSRVSASLVWEGTHALPSLEELDRYRLALRELVDEASMAGDRERLAALRAVHAQLSRLAELVPAGRLTPPTGAGIGA